MCHQASDHYKNDECTHNTRLCLSWQRLFCPAPSALKWEQHCNFALKHTVYYKFSLISSTSNYHQQIGAHAFINRTNCNIYVKAENTIPDKFRIVENCKLYASPQIRHTKTGAVRNNIMEDTINILKSNLCRETAHIREVTLNLKINHIFILIML